MSWRVNILICICVSIALFIVVISWRVNTAMNLRFHCHSVIAYISYRTTSYSEFAEPFSYCLYFGSRVNAFRSNHRRFFLKSSYKFRNFIKKETPIQAFSCEFCEIVKNTSFEEHLQTTVSALLCSLQRFF